ncbi:MAG: hypothetical protein D6730_07865 [Bacteroidetes bacterium]|nr:MAG: hypothetical protein D6730_07865 [Bacteroidota bacterium]
MNITIINRSPAIRNWIEKDYPAVRVCPEVCRAARNSEAIILLRMYAIKGEAFEALSMWQRYLRKHNSRTRLMLMGWEAHPSPNYLSIPNMPVQLEQAISKAHKLKAQDSWWVPPAVDPNLLIRVRQFLLSHGDRTFHRQLLLLRTPLGRLERKLRQYPISQLSGEPYTRQVKTIAETLQELWREAAPYFMLMPDYPELKCYLELEEKLKLLLEEGREFEPKLYQQVGTYLDGTLSAITDFYSLDQPL